MNNDILEKYDPVPLREIILASASPRRASLLQNAGFVSLKIMIPHVKETDDPIENARLKAEEIAGACPEAIVVGADTVIRLNNRIIGKPADLNEARTILTDLSGRTHEVSTGVCVRCVADEVLVRFEETTRVTFRKLTATAIDRYLKNVNVLDKAGAYAIQEHGEDLISTIDGSFTNVIGLPVERLTETLHYLLNLP